MADWEIVTGKNPVLEALKAGRAFNKILLQKDAGGCAEIIRLAQERGIPIQQVGKEALAKHVRGGKSQGVVALAAGQAYADLAQLLAAIDNKALPLVLALDHLEDPTDLGNIIRTAETVGADGIIIPTRRSVGLTPAVGRASAGAWEYVPVVRVANLVQTLTEFQDKGCWVIGAEASAPELYYAVDYKIPLVLVLGSEGKGLSRLVREKCDLLVRLPVVGRINSLNVASTAAVLMYEVLRQRQG